MRHLTNIFRRLYRIFAHAWFQHRDVFWEVEGHDGLYIFFKTVCDMYNLIPEDNYTVPPEAEGQDAQQPAEQATKDGKRLTILRKEDDTPGLLLPETNVDAPGATTRRHKHSPSTGSRVTTIAESAEDAEESEQPLLPEVHEGSGQKKAEEQPVLETIGGAESTDEQTADTSIATQEKLEAQEEKAEEETEASESQSSEPQSTERQQPELESSEAKQSETGAPEPEPSETETAATEEEKEPDQPTEEQKEPTETEESNGDNQSSQQTSEAEKPAIEEESSANPSQPEPETESKATDAEVAAKTAAAAATAEAFKGP